MESSESLWKTSESDEEDADDDADACATLCSRSGVSVRVAEIQIIFSIRRLCVVLESTECITVTLDEWG